MANEPQAAAGPKTELERLREEVANFKTWGIIEIAVRNPNVSEYMTHWEERATSAEAELEEVRNALKEAQRHSGDIWHYSHRTRENPAREAYRKLRKVLATALARLDTTLKGTKP